MSWTKPNKRKTASVAPPTVDLNGDKKIQDDYKALLGDKDVRAVKQCVCYVCPFCSTQKHAGW